MSGRLCHSIQRFYPHPTKGMEQVLAKLALTGATFVGKAAFSYATSLALNRIKSFVKHTKSNVQLQTLQQLEKKLQTKLAILTPVIDLCELSSAKGYTSLESCLVLTQDLKHNLCLLGATMDDLPPEPSASALQDLVDQFKALINDVDDLIPLLHLALQASGTQFMSQLGESVSPNRLLNASNAISLAHSLPEMNIQVGEAVEAKLYTLFKGSARKPSRTDWTWKEDYCRCRITIWKEKSLCYSLLLQEDLRDGRDHEGKVYQGRFTNKCIGRTKTFNILCIQRLFYASSGTLLNITDSTHPVLVLKVVQYDESDGSSTPVKSPVDWLALELYQEEPDSESEDESELGQLTRDLNQLKFDAPKNNSLGQLCLIEYMIRLCSLEMHRQQPHNQCNDQILCHYLLNDIESLQPTFSPAAMASPIVKNRLADKFLQVSE